MRDLIRVGVLGVMMMTAGCGTVVNGMHQDLAVTSMPGGSRVSIDGAPAGTTPVVVPVRRSHSHVVKVERDGYLPVEASVVPVTSTWEWGNILFAGVIGVAVDAWTGGMFELSQDRVSAQFPSKPDRSEPVKP